LSVQLGEHAGGHQRVEVVGMERGDIAAGQRNADDGCPVAILEADHRTAGGESERRGEDCSDTPGVPRLRWTWRGSLACAHATPCRSCLACGRGRVPDVEGADGRMCGVGLQAKGGSRSAAGPIT
jgi:hypothetical protein